MLRKILSAMVLIGAVSPSVWADMQFGKLKWGRDGRLTLTLVYNGSNLEFKGNLKAGEEGQPIQSGDFTALLKSYDTSQNFVSAIVTSTVDFEHAYLFLLEAPEPYRMLTNRPIEDRAAELQPGLADSLSMLDRLGIRHPADQFKKIAAWQDAHGGGHIADFADAAEKGDPSITNPTPPRQMQAPQEPPQHAQPFDPSMNGGGDVYDNGPDYADPGAPAPNVDPAEPSWRYDDPSYNPFDNSYGVPPRFPQTMPGHRPPVIREPPPEYRQQYPQDYPPDFFGSGSSGGFWEN